MSIDEIYNVMRKASTLLCIHCTNSLKLKFFQTESLWCVLWWLILVILVIASKNRLSKNTHVRKVPEAINTQFYGISHTATL